MTSTQIIAIVIFLVTMAAIMTEKLHRTVAAVAGALLLILTGVLSVESGFSYVDLNTLGVLIGMMLFVAVVKNSGIFEYIAIKAAKIAKGRPWPLMVLFALITAVLSAFLDNVTTVLLIGPMTLAITSMLRINPIPFFMTQIMASNIGGTATLIGDPPNIMIGSAAGLSFTDFITNTGVAVLFVLAATIVCFYFIYGRKLHVEPEAMDSILQLDENKAIKDRSLLIKSVVMILLVVFGFVFHSQLHLESCTIALTAAAVMLLIGRQDVEEIVAGVGMDHHSLLHRPVHRGGRPPGDGRDPDPGQRPHGPDRRPHDLDHSADPLGLGHCLLVPGQHPLCGHPDSPDPHHAEQRRGCHPLWWAVSLGACLGGNGTLIGASANVVLSGISNRHGFPITFASYFKVGFPLMLVSVAISTVFLLLRFT